MRLVIQLPPQTHPRKRTRANDPETSLIAAARVDMREKYVQILSKLAGLSEAVTYHELIDASNYGRITELHRAGLIESVGAKPAKGRLWVITATGREALTNH